MGITQNTGASSLIRPGVIDNTAARPASPYEGQVIFQKDTDQLLVWNGTAWIIPNSPAQNPPGLELVRTQTLSAVSSESFNDVFNTNYDNYMVIANILSSNSNILVNFRMRVGGADNNTASSYLRNSISQAGATVSGAAVTSDLGLFSLFDDELNGGSAIGYFFNPFKAEATKFISDGNDTNSGGFQRRVIVAHNQTVSYTGFTLIPSAGTMTGSVSVYGFRK